MLKTGPLDESAVLTPEHSAGPLSGLRIIAVEQFGAGPMGTLFLADLGAEVIKVEDPHAAGDIGRHVPPLAEGGTSLYFEAFNRGKRSIALDLKTPAGRRAFDALVADADAVYSNLRGDLAESLGLVYAVLGQVNPAVVCVALSGYGNSGERAKLPAYDALIQAEVGWASITGDPDGEPIKSGLSLVDYIGGLTSALGLLARVVEARRSGRGGDVTVDLYRSALAMYAYQATWLLTRGIRSPRQPLSAHASIVPFQFFSTADGHLAVACAKDKFYRDLIRLLGLQETADDPRFTTFAGRREHREELLAVLSDRFLDDTTDNWIALLNGSVPVAPVRSADEALGEDELAELGMLASYVSPVFGEVRGVGSPIGISGYTPTYRAAPGLGVDGVALLQQAGLSGSAIQELRADGAFGAAEREVGLDTP
jgi:crotonobetainyl-CoA:carnitine CoA-transferase CaiB-like acyl-CoA transferase